MKMEIKKISAVLTAFLLSAASVFAFGGNLEAFEEGEIPEDEFAISDYALLEGSKSGGGAGIAIPCFQKNSFFIKDEVSLNLYFSNLPASEGTMIGIGDKLIFGSIKELNGFAFRSYGYMKCVYGFTKDDQYNFMTSPMVLEMGGAGGFEFLFSRKKGFFAEFGGGAVIKSWGSVDKSEVAKGCFDGSYVCLTTGLRHYF